MLLSWIIKQWSWKSFVVGAGAVAVGATVGKPVLVSAVKSGMDLADYGAKGYEQAKAEVIAIKNEATRLRSAGAADAGALNDILAAIQADLKSLRQDVADAKVTASKKASA
jgi:hypothetical protein